jgi:hypothetical protein
MDVIEVVADRAYRMMNRNTSSRKSDISTINDKVCGDGHA